MKCHDIGALGENTAIKFLKKNGYRILERNRHESHNEIDVIAVDREHIVFVEVKARSVTADGYSPYGSPASFVTKGKQERLLHAASQYLQKNPRYHDLQPRLDVIEVYVEKATEKILNVHHIENAFGRY